MDNNSTVSPPDNFNNLCSLSDVPRNRNSFFSVVSLSISVFIAFLSPVAVVGNVLVIAAIWRNPSLRTPSYILLCGLAFTDLFTGLVTQPFYVAFEVICAQKTEGKDHSAFLNYAINISRGCGTYFCPFTAILITLMSIERWLHMTRRSLLTVRRSYYIVALVSLLLIPQMVVRSAGFELTSDLILFIIFLFCIIATSFAYFKVFHVIRHQQQQVNAHESAQNFGRPAIDLTKYKKTVLTILYILGIFYIGYLPFLFIQGISFAFHNVGIDLEMAFMMSLLFLFLSSSINPLMYMWRMTDIRNGVKLLLKNSTSLQAN